MFIIKRLKKCFFFSCLYLIISFSVNSADYDFASIEYLTEQEIARIVLPQVYQRIGREISISPLPANRAQYEANSGIKDGEALRIFNYGLENKNLIRVPTPYYYLNTTVFSLKGKQITLTNKADLAHYKIGKVSGVKHTENITKGLSKVYNSTSTKHLFQQLLLGNIDIALTNLSNGLLTIKHNQFQKIEVINPSLEKLDLYHYIHKDHKYLVNPINMVILQMKESGELNKIIKEAETITLK
ncbi:substrate-binding periplasmic protein [Colwelliaceae bacterium 6441]